MEIIVLVCIVAIALLMALLVRCRLTKPTVTPSEEEVILEEEALAVRVAWDIFNKRAKEFVKNHPDANLYAEEMKKYGSNSWVWFSHNPIQLIISFRKSKVF